MKHCSKCDRDLPLDAFYGPNRTPCKECRKKYAKERYSRLSKDERYQRNKDAGDKRTQERREYQLMRMYGLTLEQYDSILDTQEGVCAICARDKKLVVDHDHETGEVRGLLCSGCNNGLGIFGDTLEGLMRAVIYLEKDSSILTS